MKRKVALPSVDLTALLPEDFVFRYELLCMRVFGRAVLSRGGSGDRVVVHGARRVTRVSTGQTETRGGARRNGVVHTDGVEVNDAALRMKRRIDRKLRLLARDMKAWMGDDNARAGVRRCSRCNRYAEDTWTFCPWDGAPTEEMN